MKPHIEIIVSPMGDIAIDAVGFKGADCEKATRFIEEAWDRGDAEQKAGTQPGSLATAAATEGGIMNVSAVVTFGPSGEGSCLYTELIDLQLIGSLHVRRASFIEFSNERQLWEVKSELGKVLFFSKTRGACLAWEQTGDLGPISQGEAA